MVVKVDRTADRQRLGQDQRAPRWAIACKFEPGTADTILLGITWQVGRTGQLTPVAELQPVSIGGRTIRRASLHNPAWIEAGGYRVGDTVRLRLAGDVIPELAGPDLARRPPGLVPCVMPLACPECGHPAKAAADGASLQCVNVSCAGRIAALIQSLGLPGVGAVKARQLANQFDDVDQVMDRLGQLSESDKSYEINDAKSLP
jgi:DNA ligase (NAD+)